MGDKQCGGLNLKEISKIISFSLKDTHSLNAAYMPFVKNGGIFIPTTREYHLGEEFKLIIHLMDENEKFAVRGKVIWSTPKGAMGNRTPGLGLQFLENFMFPVHLLSDANASTSNNTIQHKKKSKDILMIRNTHGVDETLVTMKH